ncbi:MAG: SDR family oxidoreductase [Acidobacteria bacterium]|nr:SDR family oxidoreductase [Acidobacteriota bacterium]
MTILVTGATGYIGGRLVPRLAAAGHRVIAMARDPQRLAGRRWEDVEIRQGDVLDPMSLRRALAGVDVAFYLVHSIVADPRGFRERDRRGAEYFGAAAQAAGVRQIVYLGGLGAEDAQLSAHLVSRHEVGQVLRASGVPVTEFRAAVVVGSGSLSFEIIRYLTERLPVIVTSNWVTTRCQPIAIANVLDYLLRSVDEPRSVGRTFEIGGPDVLTYGDMLRGYAAVRGLRRGLISVPMMTPHLCSRWVDFVTSIPASYSYPLIEGLRHEVIVRDPSAREIFNIDLIHYGEAVRRATERTRLGEVETAWDGAQASRQPGVSLRATEGLTREVRRVESAAPPADVYRVFAGIGGGRGWFHADWLWQLRGLIDRLAGGAGMRRGRRSADNLRPGDELDFWRVEAVEPGHLIRLRAEMALPGLAWLQFEARPRPEGGTLLIQTAFFEPHGFFGFAYWHMLYPIHRYIFSGLARAVVRRAELASGGAAAGGKGP